MDGRILASRCCGSFGIRGEKFIDPAVYLKPARPWTTVMVMKTKVRGAGQSICFWNMIQIDLSGC